MNTTTSSEPVTRDRYGYYDGSSAREMPKLKESRRLLITIAEVINNRLNGTLPSEEVRDWRDKYVITGDGNIRYPDHSGAIVLDANYIQDMNPNTRLTPKRAIALGNHPGISGTKILYVSEDRIRHIHGRLLSKAEAENSPEWLFLARQNQTRLKEYVDMEFERGKILYGHDKAMAIYFGNPEEETAGYSLCIANIATRSFVRADNPSGNRCHIGVAQEELEKVLSA
jgi:hypothetical protein